MDENGLPGRQRRHAVEGERRRHVGDRDGRGLGVAQRVGKAKGLRGGHNHAVGIASESRQRDDPVAFVRGGHASPDGVHDPGDLVSDDDRRLWRVGVEAHASEDIGEIDPGGSNGDADFSLAGDRVGQLAQLEDLRRAVARDDHLPHDAGE